MNLAQQYVSLHRCATETLRPRATQTCYRDVTKLCYIDVLSGTESCSWRCLVDVLHRHAIEMYYKDMLHRYSIQLEVKYYQQFRSPYKKILFFNHTSKHFAYFMAYHRAYNAA